MSAPDPAAVEREKIVRWLREQAATSADTLRCLHKMRTLDFQQTREWENLISAYRGAAEAIASNQHKDETDARY